jgi:hypothetical protein
VRGLQLLAPGHFFMGHTSMTAWIGNVVSFLRKNDIEGDRR